MIKDLYTIPRSLTGNGVRQTLTYLQEFVPLMTIHEVPSGTKAFDWVVPPEWNIRDAWIKDPSGKKIIDFHVHNLHVMGYSTPIHKKCSLSELLEHVYTLPEQPDLIPYITSYYKERYGFCMSENQKKSLIEGEYEIYIDSDLNYNGSLTYGEIVIASPDPEAKEIFFSTYTCHPQMTNNELSGPVLAIHLAKWLIQRPHNRFTYRFYFGPETIGSLVYLSKNLDTLSKNMYAGFVLTCVGDDRAYTYLASPYGNTIADKVAKNILDFHAPNYIRYSYLERGSDERQYCAPGIQLPMCSVMRTRYGDYPEYHTSADDLTLVTESGLQGSFSIYQKIINTLEANYCYKAKCLGEPQLGKRGLYPTISTKQSGKAVRDMMNVIAYADGTNDIIDISNRTHVNAEKVIEIINQLIPAGIVARVQSNL